MVEEINKTKVLPFVYGCFGFEKWKIPYFSLTMELRDAADFLTLTADLPGDHTQDFKVDELYQRDIDWKRVERDIAPYLLEADQPQFFGALTVVMLPYSSSKKRIVHSFSSEEGWIFPAMGEGFQKKIDVGPISLGFFNDFSEIGEVNSLQGRMIWNRDQAFAVAIDGQHRLAAMKEVRQIISNDPNHPLGKVRVPVNILIFDEKVGFSSPNDADADNVRLMRKIFIDVNKHAAKVKRARQLLLDDSSPQALCLRTLISDKLSPVVNTSPTSTEPISLALINWHSEDAKFDKGPYVSTVLSLDSLLAIALQASGSDRPTDYTAAVNQIKKLRTGLQIKLEKSGAALDLARDKGRPFAFPADELKEISASFSAAWVPAFRRILLGFSPYAALCEKRTQQGSFSIEWQIWYRLWATSEASQRKGRALQELEKFESELANRNENPMFAKPMNDLREDLDIIKDNSLAFAVVFQKALFMAFSNSKAYRNTVFNAVTLTDAQKIKLAESKATNVASIAEEVDGEDEFSQKPTLEISLDDFDQTSIEYQAQPSPGSVALGIELDIFASLFIESLNEILKEWPKFLERNTTGPGNSHDSVLFWDGSLLRDEQINFTDAAAKRASTLIEILFLMHMLFKAGKFKTFDELWSIVIAEQAPTDPLLKEFRKLVTNAVSKDYSIGHMILSRQNIPWIDENRDKAREEVKERLSRAFTAIKKACK